MMDSAALRIAWAAQGAIPPVAKGVQAINNFLMKAAAILSTIHGAPTWHWRQRHLVRVAVGSPGMALADESQTGRLESFQPEPRTQAAGPSIRQRLVPRTSDDSRAVILTVLEQVATAAARQARAMAYGMNWTLGMQSRNRRLGCVRHRQRFRVPPSPKCRKR